MNTKPDATARWPAWLAAAIGVALTLAAFYPGLMSHDSAGQYAQAMGLRRLDDVHPPLMTWLWRMTNGVVAGPGGIFVVFVVAWWSGLAALVSQCTLGRAASFGIVLAAGLFPSTFLMLGHVWKDVGMAAALLLAAAAVHAHRRGAGAGVRWSAIALLAIACALRHNGLFAALPLLAWLCWPRPGEPFRIVRQPAIFTLLVAVLAVAPAALATAMRAERAQAWTAVALWDLAAVSIDAQRVLLPASLVTPDLSVQMLERAYVPYANPPLFDLGKIRLSFFTSYSDAQWRDLKSAWIAAVRAHPVAYLRHRARLSRYLWFGFPAELPRELVYVPQRIVPPDANLTLPAVDESSWLWRLAAWLRPTPLFAGALYLALGAVAAVLVRRQPHPARGTVFALVGSAWANALPLSLISGSAEFRYLAWTALAAVLAFALAVFGRRANIG